MEILFSGLNESTCIELLGTAPDDATLRWLALAEFTDHLANRAHSAPDTLAIWFYRAPWSAAGPATMNHSDMDVEEEFVQWLRQNRDVLNVRGKISTRLMLVNAERVASADLLSGLMQPTSRRGGKNNGQRQRPEPAQTVQAGDSDNDEQASLSANPVGKLLAWIAPQYWDVFEALEAAAWLPDGEPLFRNALAPDEGHLFAMLQTLREGTLQSAVHGEIVQLRKSEQKQNQANQELTQESELLLIQLHQVQEELEQYYLKNIELAKTIDRGNATPANDAAEAKRMATVAQQESKALKLKLRQMQDELKRVQQQKLKLEAPETASSAVSEKITAPPSNTPGTAPKSNGTTITGSPASSDSQSVTAPRTPGPHARRSFARLLPAPARKALHKPVSRRQRQRQLSLIKKSGWFDGNWYLETYPDVRASQTDPTEHYFATGWKENRNPCTGFDTAYYLRCNPDIMDSGLNPLWHFIQFGQREGRLPHKP